MQKSSAKRRGRVAKRSSKAKSSKLLKYATIFIIIIFGTYLLVQPKHWDGQSVFSITYPLKSGDVQVSVFDPSSGEITSIVVPSNLEVETAQGFGIWKIGSVWELGEKEKLDGSLLAQTITSHLKFPVHFWANEKGAGLVNGKLSQMLPALISTSTNIPLADRIRLAYFSMSTKNPDRSIIDLQRTTYIRSKSLADDTKGFALSGKIPQSLASIFADKSIANRTVRVEIKDATNIYGVSVGVGELLEAIGAKVTSVNKKESVDTKGKDCLISSSTKDVSKRIALFLGCSVSDTHSGNFDIEIRLSKEFGERF